MGHRRKSREIALQGLYMYDTVGETSQDLSGLGWIEEEVPAEISDFAKELISGTIKNIGEVDALIVKYAKNWKFDRIASIDKSILRLSIYALVHLKTIPAPVTINEAIELGKIYGGENSAQFINGILDAVHKSELK